MKNKQFIISKFKKVKELGFVESRRQNNTGIGKTIEDYIGVLENNIDDPDFVGNEIKSHSGSAFKILEKNLYKLYSEHEKVE